MILDGREVAQGATIRTSVCVIGGGAAGITLARSLSDKTDVVVLEAGGEEPTEEGQSFYEGAVEGDFRPEALTQNRLRLFGGTTHHWGGHCYPLSDLDLRERSWVPNSGWPITSQELAPYYAAAAKFMGLASTPGTETPKALAQELRGAYGDPFQPHFFRVAPVRFGPSHRSELAAASRVKVMLHSPVFSIRSTADRTHVLGVRTSPARGRHFDVRAQHYVLATGGVENARILLLNELGNANDNVGRYFMVHPALSGGLWQVEAAHWEALALGTAFTHNGHKFVTKVGPTAATQQRLQCINSHVLFSVHKGGSAQPPNVLVRTNQFASGQNQVLAFRSHAEQSPQRDSRIRLDPTTDPMGHRRALVEWKHPAHEKAQALRAITYLAEQLATRNVARLKWPEELHDRVDATWGHHIGATRMTRDPKRGVVDPNCRVHGMDNLHLAGASTFTTGGAANPTFTIVALALRLADHLAARV